MGKGPHKRYLVCGLPDCNLGAALEELLGRLYQELSKASQSVEELKIPLIPVKHVAATSRITSDVTTIPSEDLANCAMVICVDQAQRSEPELESELESELEPGPRPAPKSRQRDIALSQVRRSARLGRYEEAVRLHALGWSQVAIAGHIGRDRKTVGRWLRKGSYPECKYPVVRRSKLDAHKAYLHKRWEQGCTNARQIWRELKQKGYSGGHTVVASVLSSGVDSNQAFHVQIQLTNE